MSRELARYERAEGQGEDAPTELPAQTPAVGGLLLPALMADAGERAWRRFVEFFTANIHNDHTRAAYVRAVARFCLAGGVLTVAGRSLVQ